MALAHEKQGELIDRPVIVRLKINQAFEQIGRCAPCAVGVADFGEQTQRSRLMRRLFENEESELLCRRPVAGAPGILSFGDSCDQSFVGEGSWRGGI